MNPKHSEKIVEKTFAYVYADADNNFYAIVPIHEIDNYMKVHFRTTNRFEPNTPKKLDNGFYQGDLIQVHTSDEEEFYVFEVELTFKGDPMQLNPVFAFEQIIDIVTE